MQCEYGYKASKIAATHGEDGCLKCQDGSKSEGGSSIKCELHDEEGSFWLN